MADPAAAAQTEAVAAQPASTPQQTAAAAESKSGDTPTATAAAAAPSDAAPEQTAERNGDARSDRDQRNGRPDRFDNRNNRDYRDNRDSRREGGRGRGRGGSSFRNFLKKPNNEFDNLPDSDDPVEIRNQVEFYFSTQNLATDEHLFVAIDGPQNRPVSIAHICTFKRMRRFKPYAAVVSALRESKDLIVVDSGEYSGERNEAIQRKEPLVVPVKSGDDERPPSTLDLFFRLRQVSSNSLETSVYVKGFCGDGDSVGDGEIGQIALEHFFRPHGAVMVRKRRNQDQSWKGSVFVEFDTEASQKKFLALDPKPKFNDNELTTMGKREYAEMKCEEKGIKPDWLLTDQEKYEQRQKKRAEARINGDSRGGRGRGGRGRGRGGRSGRGGSERWDGNRDRSPRSHRDRSASVDSRDWNTRRDRYQNGKDDTPTRKEDRKEIDRDAHGVPIVKETMAEPDNTSSNKRKAEDDNNDVSPKKNKLEIKQDE